MEFIKYWWKFDWTKKFLIFMSLVLGYCIYSFIDSGEIINLYTGLFIFFVILILQIIGVYLEKKGVFK